MLKNLRVGWRQFVKDPGYTAVIMLGLSVAIACCYLVAQIVFNQVLPDPDVPDPAQVVNIEFRGNIPGRVDDWYDQAPFLFAPTLREAHAPVSAISRWIATSFNAHADDRVAPLNVVFADPDLIEVFGLKASAGDLHAALNRPDTLALTLDAAKRLFPAGDALGKTVTLHGHAMTVVALMQRRSQAAMPYSDALASFETSANTVPAFQRKAWYSMSGKVFARVAPGHTAVEVGQAAQALFDGPGAQSVPKEWSANGRKAAFLRATPLTRQYLEGGGYLDGGGNGHTHLMLLLGLGAGAALMLGLAVTNYVNLTSVRTLARAREIAVRKTLGASPWRLTAQFVFESALAAMVAATVGLLLAWWVAPVVGDLLDISLADGLFSPARIALLITAALGLGLLTGLYPARIALSVHCIAALAGRSLDEGAAGRMLRRAMTTLQFVVALVIGTGAGVVLWQNRYVASLDHGVKTAGLLAVNVPDGYSGKFDAINAAFREAVSHEPGVEATAWSMDVPGRAEDRQDSSFAKDRASPIVLMNQVPVGKSYFDVYGITIVAGATRMPALATVPAMASAASAAPAPAVEQPVVIDVEASRAMGFASPQAAVGALVLGGGYYMTLGKEPRRVVAVASNIRLESARDPVRPHVFLLSANPQSTLTLQGARMDQLRQAVARVWPRFFPDDLASETMTVEEAQEVPYRFERHVAQMAMGTSLMALLLSAFGVYALAAYTVRRSAREIVIRKLYGASRARIARLLAREFTPLLLIAALIGLPLAGWLAHAWLTNFIERSPTAFWTLPLVLIALIAVTALAALRHAVVAMTMRPMLALRD